MLMAWLDESGDVNCYQGKEGQTPIFVLCCCILKAGYYEMVLDELKTIEDGYKKELKITDELKGNEIAFLRPQKKGTPHYVVEADKKFLENMIGCFANNEARVIARAFAKRIVSKFSPSDLYSFAHLTLFEQIFLFKNQHFNVPFKTEQDIRHFTLPLPIIADTLPTASAASSRHIITQTVREIERLSGSKFSVVWSFDFSSENIFIRTVDVFAKVLYNLAHNRWSVNVKREPIYTHTEQLWDLIKPIMHGTRAYWNLKPVGEAKSDADLFRIRWYPKPYNDVG